MTHATGKSPTDQILNAVAEAGPAPAFFVREDGVEMAVMPRSFFNRIYSDHQASTAQELTPDHPIWDQKD